MILKNEILKILKLKNQAAIKIFCLVIASAVFIVVMLLYMFEMSFDRYHDNYEDIYRVQNNRIYINLDDLSAGCPPATAVVLKNEVPGVSEVVRVKPLISSVIEFDGKGDKRLFNHNNLFYSENSFFKIFKTETISGDISNALKDQNTCVVTRSFCEKYYGDVDVIGEEFKCSGSEGMNNYKITAIIEDLPDNSYLNFDCLLSYSNLVKSNKDAAYTWGWNAYNTYVKLSPETDIGSVHKSLDKVVEKYGLSPDDYIRYFRLQPLKNIHLYSDLRHEIGRRRSAITINILLIIAFFIIIVAWINYANITTAKSKKQILELNIKRYLGCSQYQLLYENISGSVVINLLSVFLAFLVVYAFLPIIKSQFDIQLYLRNFTSWIIILSVTTILSVLAGLYATFNIRHLLSLNQLVNRKKHKNQIWQNFLVVTQFVISIVFIISTLVIVKQLDFLEKKKEELSINNVVVIRSSTENSGEVKGKVKAFVNELETRPGIVNISVSGTFPGAEYTNVIGGVRPLNHNSKEGIKCFFADINSSYFDLFKIRFVGGRNFKKSINQNNNIILNSTAVKLMGIDDPSKIINKQIVLGEYFNKKCKVIGVVEDYHHKSLLEPVNPMIFIYKDNSQYISVRYDKTVESEIIPLAKRIWKKTVDNIPFDYYFNDSYYMSRYNDDKLFRNLVSLFAFLIVIISLIGLFALVRINVNRKVKEIGIRKVNGATSAQIIKMLNTDIIKKVVVAFVMSTPLAYYIMDIWLGKFAYRTKLSPEVFALGGAITLIVVLITVFVQSYKASVQNPVKALRYE